MKTLLFLFGFLVLANAQDTPSAPPATADANAILSQAFSKYKSLDTYSSSGTIVSDMEVSGTKIETTTTFSIKLKKPNLYLVTWSQTGATPTVQAGAVWSDGTQPYLYMGIMNAYSKIGDDASALGGATGISGGAAYTVPSLFLPAFTDKGFAFSRLQNPIVEKVEPIGGEDCYVVSGSSNASKKETLWISKSSSLILKYERSFEPPAGGMVIPEISDADLKKAIQAMGQPVTDEALQKMREMMASAQQALKGGSSGLSTETQTEIATPNLGASDFQFTPPPGATLKETLFDGSGSSQTIKSSPSSSGATGSYETVQAPVLKVFSARDGTNKFVAYLVKWKDFEVVVSDPLAKTDLKVGDTVKFLAQKIDVGKTSASLAFTLLN